MAEYKYGMRLRGAAPGAQPSGFISFEDTDKRTTGYYSILTYDRQLTEKEIRDYDLDDLTEKPNRKEEEK